MQVSSPATTSSFPVTVRNFVGRISPEVRIVLGLFAVSRLIYLVITFAVIRSLDPLAIATVWTRWDGGTYTHIAAAGYPSLVDVAFFPLFPLLEHIVMPLTGGVPSAAGLLIANVSSLAAVLGLAAYVRGLGWQSATAVLTVGLFLAFPTAFFAAAPYTEGLFLALVIWSLRALQTRNYLLAGVLGLFASATRQAGVLLVVPFLIEYLRLHDWKPRSLLGPQILWCALIPLGLVAYMAYLVSRGLSPLAFAQVEHAWGRNPAPPWVSVAAGFRMVAISWGTPEVRRHILDLASVLLMLALCVYGWVTSIRRREFALMAGLAFCSLALIMSISAPDSTWPLLSQSRYMLEMLPLFAVLARLLQGRRVVLGLWLAISLVGELYFTSLYVRGGWIF